ncbi:hypothetical protein ACP275_14G080900 [Erythranthe tilingii]
MDSLMENSRHRRQTNAKKTTSRRRRLCCCDDDDDDTVRVPFQIVTTTLISLLLPLSFLLLARLSTAQYLLSATNNYPKSAAAAAAEPTSLLCSLFLNSKKPTILHILVTLITVSSLSYALTGKFILLINHHSSDHPSTRRRLYAAWWFLFVFQVCVGLWIEGSIADGIDGSGFGQENSFLLRVVFFFGLHETIVFWGRTVVKPVVDDTIFGYWRKEGWVEKAAVGLSYGWFWWWRLREEVEALVVVPSLKTTTTGVGVGVADFMGWWLYYLTVTIGIVRIVRVLILTALILTRRRKEGDGRRLNDDKV